MAQVYGDFIQCVLRWSLAGWDDQINVLNLGLNGGTPLASGDATQIAAAFEDWMTAHAGAVSASYALAEITIRDMTSPTTPAYVFSVGIPGSDASALLPPGNALVMTLNTGFSGKAYRGRVYLGGFCESVNGANGTLDSGSQASIEGNFGDLVAALAALAYPLSVVSKVFNGAPRATALVTPVATFQMDQQFDRQKRRGS